MTIAMLMKNTLASAERTLAAQNSTWCKSHNDSFSRNYFSWILRQLSRRNEMFGCAMVLCLSMFNARSARFSWWIGIWQPLKLDHFLEFHAHRWFTDNSNQKTLFRRWVVSSTSETPGQLGRHWLKAAAPWWTTPSRNAANFSSKWWILPKSVSFSTASRHSSMHNYTYAWH